MGVAYGSLTAANQTVGPVEGSDVELLVNGTFVATVALEAVTSNAAGADVWVQVATLTAPGVSVFRGVSERKYRARCSAFTSGTAVVEIVGMVNEDLIGT